MFLLLAAAAALLLTMRSNQAPAYETAPVVRGGLIQTVTAPGTINPRDTISVGTQVSGTIESLYVDCNSSVHQGLWREGFKSSRRLRNMVIVAPTYSFIRDWRVNDGVFFSQNDTLSAAKVCVLGQIVVRNLFPDRSSPIGKTSRT